MAALTDKVVFITGAASGIGAAIAVECARRGASLVLIDFREPPLEEVAARVRAFGREALAIAADVASDEDLPRAAEAARRRFGRIDLVVANAGFEVTGRVEELTVRDFRRQFDTNVFGVLRTVYATLDDLKRSRGSLVIMGSLLGYVALPGTAAYAMSKFAVTALAHVLRYELASNGISVTLISPGNVTTNIRRVDNYNRLHAEAKDPIPAWLRMSPDAAARSILNAAMRRRSALVLTAVAKMALLMERLAPAIVDRVIRLGRLRGHKKPGGFEREEVDAAPATRPRDAAAGPPA
jgi:short-subunit dehydrogenase